MGPIYRFLLFFLIFCSGCAGLIYEVVWHRYLGILLGAQARATAVILAIFLGGIATGYAFFGRWTRKRRWNLLKAYAIVEILLFVWACLFPLLFRLAVPAVASLYGVFGLSSILIDLIVSLALIGFPTFLMGGTLPLLTQGLSEDLKSASHTHAKIYGVNTLGACAGCLSAGYFLIPHLGLLGANWYAAILNLMVGVIAYVVYAKKFGFVQKTDETGAQVSLLTQLKDLKKHEVALLVVGLLSGFYLITLQTVIIRLVGLSTGSSNYNFALVVSIFIFALGLGSLLAKRIASYTSSQLFWNQIGVAFGFFLLYLSGDYWSYWGHIVRVLFRDLPETFIPYQASLGFLFLALLIIPIGMAGLTLPLCFHLIKDRKETLGERVGQLYGLNSVGCVLGAILGGYWMLEFLNLDQLFKFCILMALAGAMVAAVLYIESPARNFRMALAGCLALMLIAAVSYAPLYDKNRFIQPFRHASPINNVTFQGAKVFGDHLARNTKYLLYKDGPNTSVGVGASQYQGKETSRTIFVNGKSDGNTSGDFFTTVVLAHLPGLLAKSTERVCMIGFGTGITTGTIALYDATKQIDVAEISGTIIANAGEFDAYNRAASKNEKVKFHEMDAFRFLGGSKENYDVIISEPSNPWVAGVENLFSREFYQTAAKHLTEEGMFVQWIHTYSFSDELFRLVLNTMAESFPYISIFELRAGDLGLVATKKPIERDALRRGANRIQTQAPVRNALLEAGIKRIETLLALELATPELVADMAKNAGRQTLEAPILSNEAAKAFFAGSSANVSASRRSFKAYVHSVRDALLVDYLNGTMPSSELLHELKESYCENSFSRSNTLCQEIKVALQIKSAGKGQNVFNEDPSANARELATLNEFSRSYLGLHKGFTASELNTAFEMFEAFKRYYSPIAFVSIDPVLSKLDRCLITLSEDQELYGECLLQKILVYEAVYGRGKEFKQYSGKYLEWFEKLPIGASNYEKLKQAKDILASLIALDN